VLALVRKSMAENNGSVLLISHDWELVRYVCDKIYVFDNGQLKEKEA